ncbi:transcriptional regulator NrdR [Myxococcota bacterium]|nr:transcriptional regulator NrdR [Myxococcota bacterium]
MRCPNCQAEETRVIDSRSSKDGYVVRRRRVCEECKGRFTTYEKIEQMLPMVTKKDQRRELFAREKITRGIMQACQKRPVSIEQVEQIADEIERLVSERSEREVESQQIGAWVMEKLRDVDQVAYVRFASVYREFRDAEEFMAELRGLLPEGEGGRPQTQG